MQSAIVFCRFLHFSLVLLMFGACLLRPFLLGAGPLLTRNRTLDWLLRLFALLALASGVAWLMLTSANMTGTWQGALDGETLRLVLGDTFFGQVWRWHLGFNLLLLISLLVHRDTGLLQVVLGGLLLATLAPVGHGAMFDGIAGQLLILNQAIHLLCVATWLGGLMLLSLLLVPPASQDIRAVLGRFSSIGYCLVAGIIVTGLINVRALSGSFWPTPLFSGFAFILLIKVSLVIAMLMLALLNRLISRSGRLGVLRTSVTCEWVLGMGAVAAVSLLGTLAPMLGF
ncbi:copper homeostasis membrane protein CopD [Pseudomonas akapageensis]|uniref:copper homeostasis membrane protein CopD n=1 Tax=Pseudomonas akapageensis TaxID=2609961 RepID=UPI00140D2F32|nr:copper homeostasis membrane protein CopD [Pseudomonas akapageensis]